MLNPRTARVKLIALVAVACFLVLAAIMAVFTVPSLKAMAGMAVKEDDDEVAAKEKSKLAKVVYDAEGKPRIALTKAGINGLQIKPVPIKRAVHARPLPPQIGTINFDNETLFPIPSRFGGEIAEIKQVYDPPDPSNPSAAPAVPRPLRYGDRVKQGDLLCVVHSVALGTAKAALVDSVCSLALSKETLERHTKMVSDGLMSLAQFRASERQVLADSNAVLTAERTLLTMKVTEAEVQEVKDEAKKIAQLAKDETFKRDAKSEAERWARVKITVPWFDRENKERELVVVEKNTSLYAMVDPIATNFALFKLADLTRVQIWVHPAEGFLPIFQKMIASPGPGGPFWTVSFDAYPDDKLPPMKFFDIAPTLEPYQHAPLVMGYLNNPNGRKYLMGQFVTVSVDLPPDPDTVEVPTQAINEIGGEALVLVQPDRNNDEFSLRRVAIVHRFRDVTIVRTKLTKVEQDENQRNAKLAIPKRTIETLSEGDLVVTRGVTELTAALENLLLEEGK